MVRKVCIAAALMAMLALPSTATAGITCSFNSALHVLDVSVTGGEFEVGLRRGADPNNLAVVNNNDNNVNCAGGPATITTTAQIIVDETATSHGTTLRLNFANGRLEPGFGAEPGGTPEIEVEYLADDENGEDFIAVTAPNETADADMRFGALAGGATGANLNGDDDVDDIHAPVPTEVSVQPGSGDDTITADGSGSPSFTGPLAGAVTVFGSAGDDTLTGTPLAFSNVLNGGADDDILTGGAGFDSFDIAEGNDSADGLGGVDFVSYSQFPNAVTLDMGLAGPQDTGGAGIDSVANVENIVGSNASDHLTGNSEANIMFGGNDPGDTGDDTLDGAAGDDTLLGRPGKDVLIGGPGNDALRGEAGNDTVSYAIGSTGPVAIDLDFAKTGVPQNTGGAGIDTLTDSTVPADPDPNHEIENVVGSPFPGDNLTGNSVGNVITGYGDGLADTVDCVGSNVNDVAILDELGVESSSNCAKVDNAPQTGVSTGPPDGSTTTDTTPSYGLSVDESGVTLFQLSIDGGGFSTCPGVSPNCDIPALADGTHTFRFRAVDDDEHHNPDPTPVQRTLTVDTTGPTVQIDDRPAEFTSDATPTWQFSSGEGGVTFRCSIDGGPEGPCSGGSSHTTTPLGDGPHTFSVFGLDAVSNAGPAVTDTFTIDTVPPDIQITQRPADLSNDSTPTWEFSSPEAGLAFECTIDTGASAPCSGPGASHTAAALADGQHTFIVIGRDAAGNASPAQLDEFALDTRAPETAIAGRARVKTHRKRVNISFTADEQGTTSECSWDGDPFAPCGSPFRTPKMKRGSTHHVELRSTDQAGNAEQEPAAVTVKRKR